jgi:tetratricopeptide (TPR) repeat protein
MDSSSEGLPEHAVQEQLSRILGSPHFSRAHKLAEFLSFVVEETLAGRVDQLKAQSIAHSVYRRGSNFEPQSNPLVRVEARRLRSRLGEYYADVGFNDPVLIEIPKGAYVPRFSDMSSLPLEPDSPQKVTEPNQVGTRATRAGPLIGAGIGGLAVGVLATWLFFEAGARDQTNSSRFTEDYEAYLMFLETRSLGRPPHIKARVLAALELARATQARDPRFGGGYAAEAFQLWQYVMFAHSNAPEADLLRAEELAQRAIKIDPEFGWGYQALSRVLSLKGDIDGAITAAEHAVELSPENAEQSGNLGLTLALTGHGAESFKPIERALRLSQGNVRTPYLNYLGIAQFHNRQFATAAETIQHNRDIGGPSGTHMFAYLAAAHAMAGTDGHARAFAEMVRSDTSGFIVGQFLRNLIVDTDEEAFLFSALDKAGLAADDLGL